MIRTLRFTGTMGILLGLCTFVACSGAVAPTEAPPDGGPDGATSQDSGTQDSGSPKGPDAGPDSSANDSGTGGDAAGDSAVGDTGQSGDGATPEVPLYHRPNDSQCAAPAPPGQCSSSGQGPGTGTCTEDSQCTSGTDGRCNNDGPLPGCTCTYDTCVTDSNCSATQVCACHGAGYSQGEGNTCVPGNCRVDSDCGPHGYCSPTTSSSTCGNVTGYYCHTASDECVNDTDCSSGLDSCEWSASDARWECQMAGLCG